MISQTFMFGLSLQHVFPQAPCSLILNLYGSSGKWNPCVSHSFTVTSSKYSLKESLDVLSSWSHIFLPKLGSCLPVVCTSKEENMVILLGLRPPLPLGYNEKTSTRGILSSPIHNCPIKPQCPAVWNQTLFPSRKWKIQNSSVQHFPRHLLFSLTLNSVLCSEVNVNILNLVSNWYEE